jgi:hypothetical protein
MHIPHRILRLAKDHALRSFSALAEQTVVDADTMTTRAMEHASGDARAELSIVRTFLRGEARTLRSRMDRHFADLLERAMVTMHAQQQRAAAMTIDYDTLTLIDDDVVTRQIEIERMVGRLREAEPMELGRVNLTIAVMHDDREARERENPFRPYLLARALYEGLRELIWDEAQSKLLYDALGQAMARRLPGFYAGILEVFEGGGITARLTARPAAMSRSERERLAWERAATDLAGSGAGRAAPGAPPGTVDEQLYRRLLPKLQRLQEMAQGGDAAAPRQQDLLDLVWDIFHKAKGVPTALAAAPASERGMLDQTLLGLQQEVAAGRAAPAPLALRELVDPAAVGVEQRRVMDIVALLFESVVHDELIGAPMQRQLARLYLPFVRAALHDPELLHQAQHPVRRLLDRLASVGAGITPAMPCHAEVDPETHNIVGAVLDLFDADLNLFADAEIALDIHVSVLLAGCDPETAVCIDAVAEAEADSARLAGCNAALSAALQPLQVDPRVADFILGTWARVLSRPGSAAEAGIALLPELLWSAQEKTTPEDRAAMMRMLPDLVRRVREGMASISLPEAPSRAAFDRLVAVHMDVLGNKQVQARRLMSLEGFRDHFAGFGVDGAAPETGNEHWVGKFELEAALARRGAAALVHGRAAARLVRSSDADWLSWARPGTGFELKVDERYQTLLLCFVAAGGGAFVFKPADEAQDGVQSLTGCVIFMRAPLLEAMETGTLRPLEPAPVFDRAVESLMTGAQSLSA